MVFAPQDGGPPGAAAREQCCAPRPRTADGHAHCRYEVIAAHANIIRCDLRILRKPFEEVISASEVRPVPLRNQLLGNGEVQAVDNRREHCGRRTRVIRTSSAGSTSWARSARCGNCDNGPLPTTGSRPSLTNAH